MILQALVQHYEHLAEKEKISRPGWCTAKVSYAIEIGEDGAVLGIVSLKEKEMRGKKEVEIPKLLSVPEMTARSSGISANFLCDNSKYLLGLDKDGSAGRTAECFAAAKKRHLEILSETDSSASKALKLFFEKWDPNSAKENPVIEERYEEVTAGGNLIFEYKGCYLQNDSDIRNAWEKFRSQKTGETEEICLITGKKAEIARIHSVIKGIPGAQSSGAALVSFNAPAFESYGKEQSYNAPVSNYAVYAYTTALNYLIAEKKYTCQLGDITVVFWAETADEECQDLFLAASEPSKENQELLNGVFGNLEKGWAVDIGETEKQINLDQRFYILGLSPNAARISVRFFYQDRFGNILQHLKEHYERMRIVKPAWDEIEYLGIWRMLQETVNQKSREKKPQAGMTGQVFEAVLSGGRYPESLYYAVLNRIRADQDDKDNHIYKITRGRAAIIKAYLLRNCSDWKVKGDDFVELNESYKDVAYTLGREFAVLEKIQMEANSDINATIKDRYFNSACATPGRIFPILIKLKNSHIRKIQNKDWQRGYEKRLENLQSNIPASGYPMWLNSEQQGRFILGYYHQRQELFTKKEEK